MSNLTIGIIIGIVILIIVINRSQSNNETFNQIRDLGSGTKLIVFYMPGCVYCERLMSGRDSIWNQIKRKYNRNKSITISEIDSTKHPELAQKYNIEGVPTIILFRSGRHTIYNGARTVEGILNFIKTAQ